MIPDVFDMKKASEEEMEKTTWGLDRVDDRSGLDNDYSPEGTGKGVHVFVVDSGIRTTHTDFGGRAFPAYEAVVQRVCNPKDTACAADINGHGTHCAGTVGGIKSGVAKNVMLHAVRIFHKIESSGTATVDAFNFVLQQKDKRPAVISASFGMAVPYTSRAEEYAIKKLAEAGITVVAAAGNDGMKPENAFAPIERAPWGFKTPTSPYACAGSPGNIKPWTFTVGSTEPPNSRYNDNKNIDKRSPFSSMDSPNAGYKNCVDIFAPGRDIISADHTSDTGFKSETGTSMACPHVSGAFALVLEKNPKMTIVDQAQKVREKATKNAVVDVQGSPNLMLYVGKGVSASTLSPKPPARECSDTPKCSKHLKTAEPGYLGGNTLTCKSYQLLFWVRRNCAKTCGFCKSESGATTAPPAETTKAVETTRAPETTKAAETTEAPGTTGGATVGTTASTGGKKVIVEVGPSKEDRKCVFPGGDMMCVVSDPPCTNPEPDEYGFQEECYSFDWDWSKDPPWACINRPGGWTKNAKFECEKY